MRCFPSLADVPEPPEFVAVAVTAERSLDVMRDAIDIGARAMLYIASGFGESGEKGRRLSQELSERARQAGLALCGPNCYGVANLGAGFAAYSGTLSVAGGPGPVAAVFQSGALTHAVTDPAVARDIRFGYVITTGNEIVTELSEYVAWIADDREVRVIACFVEGLKAPDRFTAAAEKALANDKQIVVLKVGRSARGQRATLAHTGAVAGEERAYDALFKRFGIVRVADVDEMIEACEFFTHQAPIPRGSVMVASISGGASGIMADVAEDVGLGLADPSADLSAQLREILPGFATVANPLDVTGAAGEDLGILERSLTALAEDAATSAVALALNTPSALTADGARLYRDMTAAAVASRRATGTAHVVFTMGSGTLDAEVLAIAHAGGVPVLQGIREALATIAKAQVAAAAARRYARPDAVAGACPPEVARLLADVGTQPLNEQRAKQLLSAAGVRVPREAIARSAREAAERGREIGFPVVVKVLAGGVLHKTEAGGVRLGIGSEAAAADGFDAVTTAARRAHPGSHVDGVVVQEMVPSGLEILVGTVNYAGIGPAVVVGLGGVQVEVLGDVAIRLAPVSVEEAREMLGELRGAPLLSEFRGRPAVDRDRVAEAVAAVSRVAWWGRDRIREIDVNPLIALPDAVVAVDGLVVPFSDEPAPPS